MKNLFFFLTLVCAFVLCVKANAKTLVPAHITVTALPVLGSANISSGAVFLAFRCTNHTNQVLPLEIVVKHGSYRNPEEHRFKRTLRLPGLSTCVAAFSIPRSRKYGHIAWQAHSHSDAVIKKDGESLYSRGDTYKGIASPSFHPELFEYLFDDIREAPLPVKEWSADSRAYANPALIVLDSKDEVPLPVQQALHLAAARGGQILVLVTGDAPWPSYAGVEVPGIPFEEKIGFGSRVVMRLTAVDNNPEWKKFVSRKHAEKAKGKWRDEYKKIRWKEKALYHYLKGVPAPAGAVPPALAMPPVPLGMLTFIMCCFVVIIGPVNFLVLKKYRAEAWSLVTIPVLSLLFTGAVIAGVFIKEGFSSKGKGIVESVLDQRTGVIAARGGFSLYSPLSVGKFHFNSDDVLNFVNSGKIRGEIDNFWTFSPTLLRPRMTFEYSVARSGYCSEKLVFSEKNGTPEVVNGLGVRLDTLYVCDGSGKFFKLGAPLEAGAKATLYAIPKLPRLAGDIKPHHYRAEVSHPFYIGPGMTPDQYEHKQTIFGRWR